MSRLTRRALIAAGAVLPAASLLPRQILAQGAPTPAPKDAYLYIIWPNNNESVKGGFWCRFGLRNMGIARAGDTTPNAGHHHLLVDVDEALKPGDTIPSDKNHLHFGAGQSEARLELPRGKHTLQLVLGDAEHRVFDPPIVSKKISVTVR
jgi:hypothetical protein